MSDRATPTVLILGASRGLGHAMAAEFLRRGWHVIGTVRGATRTELHDLADDHPDHLDIETADITEPTHLATLRRRLSGQALDVLFINAGTTNQEQTLIGEESTEEFVRVMVTNALSPMRAVETLQDLVTPTGLIGAMTSGQGSITNNTTGGREVYRASKAALNTLMRSFAARDSPAERALVLMAPGWVRTALGGPEALLSIEESIPSLIEVLLAKRDRPGLEYLDYRGHTVPW